MDSNLGGLRLLHWSRFAVLLLTWEFEPGLIIKIPIRFIASARPLLGEQW